MSKTNEVAATTKRSSRSKDFTKKKVMNLTRDELKAYQTLLQELNRYPKDHALAHLLTPKKIKSFLLLCEEKNLNPITGEVIGTMHKVYEKRGRNYNYNNVIDVNITAITTIQGYLKMAQKSGDFAGCSDVRYNLRSDGSFDTIADIELGNKGVITATVTVWRMQGDIKADYTASVSYAEFYSKPQSNQKTMPCNMLGKTALAAALRKAFGEETSGIYTTEDLQNPNWVGIGETEVDDVVEIVLTPEEKIAKEKAKAEIEAEIAEAVSRTYTKDIAKIADAKELEAYIEAFSVKDDFTADHLKQANERLAFLYQQETLEFFKSDRTSYLEMKTTYKTVLEEPWFQPIKSKIFDIVKAETDRRANKIEKVEVSKIEGTKSEKIEKLKEIANK